MKVDKMKDKNWCKLILRKLSPKVLLVYINSSHKEVCKNFYSIENVRLHNLANKSIKMIKWTFPKHICRMHLLSETENISLTENMPKRRKVSLPFSVAHCGKIFSSFDFFLSFSAFNKTHFYQLQDILPSMSKAFHVLLTTVMVDESRLKLKL